MKKEYVSAVFIVKYYSVDVLNTSGADQFEAIGSWKDAWSSGGEI